MAWLYDLPSLWAFTGKRQCAFSVVKNKQFDEIFGEVSMYLIDFYPLLLADQQPYTKTTAQVTL
jgi:hypothetical protein